MKKTKSITKEKIIEALREEPLLRRGFWFGIKTKSAKSCSVCAVGSILRKMSFEKWAAENNISGPELGDSVVNLWELEGSVGSKARKVDIEDHIQNENYLAALSGYFENGHTRKQCIEFVKKHFPKRLTVTVNL